MRLRVRFILAFAVITTITVAFGILSLTTHHQLQKAYLNLENVYVPALSSVMEIRITLVNLSVIVHHGIETPDDERQVIEALESLAANRDTHHRFLAHAGLRDQSKHNLHNIRDDINTVIATSQSFIASAPQGVHREIPAAAIKKFDSQKERLLRRMDLLIEAHQRELKSAEARVRRVHDRGARFVWLGIALSAGAAGVIGLFMAQTVLAPLMKLRQGARLIGQGDLDYRLDIKTGDEIERVAEAFNAMAADLKHHQERLVATERHAAVGVATEQVLHTTKNILNVFTGGRYIINKALEKDDRDGLLQGWRMMEQGIGRMTDLTRDILDFTRGKTLNRIPYSLNAIAAEVADTISFTAGGEGIRVVFTPDPSIPPVTLDPGAMHSVLMNLVTNAVDACRDKIYGNGQRPEICMRTFAGPGNHVSVHVSDNGGGISQDILDSIFTPFFSTKFSKGNGLGLPIAQKIIQEHGGDILVSSDPGSGVSFTVKMPAS